MNTKSKLNAVMKLSFEQRQAIKAETKAIAQKLAASGYEVFSSGYGGVTMRLNPEDAGHTVVYYEDARELIAA